MMGFSEDHSKIVLVSPEVIHELLVEGNKIPQASLEVISGIPEGAIFMRGFYDSQRDVFGLVYYHASFESDEGDKWPYGIPTIDVEIRSIYDLG